MYNTMKRMLFGLCLALMPITMMAQQLHKMWVNMPIHGTNTRERNLVLYVRLEDFVYA